VFYSTETSIRNNTFKENIKNFDNIQDKLKTSNLVNLFIFFCNQRQFLNKKIVNFFFHIVFLSVKRSTFIKQMSVEKKKFLPSHKALVLFSRFVHFVISFSNNIFRKNSEIFFSEKKNLTQFLLYYKSVYYSIFLNENYKNFNSLAQFNFALYSNYLVYSIFYFLRLYIQNLQDLELKEIGKKNDFFLPFQFDINRSQTFYADKVFVNDFLRNKTVIALEKNIYLSALCCSRMNFKTLEDGQLSILLNNIRSIYRFKDQRKNSLLILNKLIKQVIPLSKIIYQRRGRSLIPLMTFVYSSDIRNSLGLKHILKESNKIQGFGLNSYENKLLIYLLDILISKHKNDLIYQFEQDSDTRKEAYNRGYFFKTLKAQSKRTQ